MPRMPYYLGTPNFEGMFYRAYSITINEEGFNLKQFLTEKAKGRYGFPEELQNKMLKILRLSLYDQYYN